MVKQVVGIVCAVLLPGWLAAAPDAAPATGSSGPATLPLWEAGVFGGVASLPHYRGSDESRLYVLPLPYLIYRGERLRANREGVKGVFWQNERFETGVSLGINPPVDDADRARRGMPELGAMAEIGPMLKCYLTRRDLPDVLYAVTAARAAFSVESGSLAPAYEGLRGEAKMVYRNSTWLAAQRIDMGLNAGVDFTDRRYSSFYYEVEPEYATAARPAYRTDGGYAGFSVSANASKRLTDWLALAVYYRWDNIAGAAYDESPLVGTENNHIFGGALIWRFHRSRAMSPYQAD